MIRREAWDRGNIGRATAGRPARTHRLRSLVARTTEAVALTAPNGTSQRLRAAVAAAVLPLLLVAAAAGCVETKQLGQVPLNSPASADATATPQTDRDTQPSIRPSTALGTQSDTPPGPQSGTRSGADPHSATANGGSAPPSANSAVATAANGMTTAMTGNGSGRTGERHANNAPGSESRGSGSGDRAGGSGEPSSDSGSGSGSDAGKRNIAGRGSRVGTAGDGGSRIPVVATFSILGEWVERVAGERARVVTLVGPGGDAHTYEPTPQAAALVADARLVFEIGLGFEGWLDKVYQASGSRAMRHAVTRAVRPRFVGPPGPDAELDPHVWQSPKLADRMVEEVVDALAEADPSHAVEYRRRGDAYREELRALDVEVRGLLAAVSRDRRVLVTTHDTFGYFAAEYGFEVLSVLESFSSEGGEPSAGELAAVIERIKARRVPAVFAENILDPRTTEQVAKEAGVAVVGTLYTDALGPPHSAGATYLGMMRHNARAITEALR